MSTKDEQRTHDESADKDLSKSLAGHEDLSKDDEAGRRSSAKNGAQDGTPADDALTSPLEEVEDSPVRTKNS